MNYSYILDEATYSYSRLKCFSQCKYSFLLKYILGYKEDNNFFAEHGTQIHECLQKYLSKELDKDSLLLYYLSTYNKTVLHNAPMRKISDNYYQAGLDYISNIDFPRKNILDVEKKVDFKVGDYDFVGFIDCVAKEDDGIYLIDHKSHNLKQRSKKSNPTLGDKELDEYLKQLYLYSIPIEKIYGELPKKLEFNCFRTNTWISEDFSKEKYEEAKQWAIDTIETIKSETDWKPNCDEYYCKNLCGLKDVCEYYSK